MASDSCTFVIKDNYGYEYEQITRLGYSQSDACSNASYDCSLTISRAQQAGRYYDAYCAQKYGPVTPNRPPIPPTAVTNCTTDLVDYYGYNVRSFTGSGRTKYEACAQSNEFCQYELRRNTSNGYRCVTRDNNGGGGSYPPPRPPRQVTESCSARRFDPSGMFIQSYFASFTGPVGSDVLGEACRRALNSCSYDIKGRQTCRIDR